jgi:hypothetical protein
MGAEEEDGPSAGTGGASPARGTVGTTLAFFWVPLPIKNNIIRLYFLFKYTYAS